MAGGAIAYGDPSAPSVGTISATETGGTFFQGSPGGTYTTAKAQLGTGDQAYYGSLALDSSSVPEPVAAFADLSGNMFVREWSGQGDVNDASTWSTRLVSGLPAADRRRRQRRVRALQRQLAQRRQPAAAADSRRAAGRRAGGARQVDHAAGDLRGSDRADRACLHRPAGVEVRTSSNGAEFSPAALTAAIPSGQSIGHLVSAATTDGGGFVSFVQDPVGGEGVGPVAGRGVRDPEGHRKTRPRAAAGGRNRLGGRRPVGDVDVPDRLLRGDRDRKSGRRLLGSRTEEPQPRYLAGEVEINGLRIIPDAGVSIGIDPETAQDRHDRQRPARAQRRGARYHALAWRTARRKAASARNCSTSPHRRGR